MVAMRSPAATTTYRLAAPQQAAAVPTLDEHQRRVLEHPGGPLLVLAGPGTGKTTTLVETIVHRIEQGARPEQVLALTFSRKAAEQLRDRVTARLGLTSAVAIGTTFHSFAYGLIRQHQPAELYEGPLQLLSAPEQDVVLQQLLTDAPESVRWPEGLRHAVGTRGFAGEVHAVLARAREKGLDGEELRRLGAESGRAELVAAGWFLDQYLDVLDSRGAIDYADLIRRAAILAEEHRDELRATYRHVFVDEYQDTDPGQVALLQALAGDGRDITVVGDPHQSIYAFRGAEVRGILEFPTTFPRRDGSPAGTVVLRGTRRFGASLLRCSQRVAARLPLIGTIESGARDDFLAPVPVGDHGDGRVQVLTYDTERAEAEHLADLLRRAHLEDDVAWDDMAVLVRSGRTSIPGLRRSLLAAGVPVEVAGDDTPLVGEPAVRTLVDALTAVLHLDDDDPRSVDHLDAQHAQALLHSHLAGLDAADVRVLARLLRTREKQRVAEAGEGAAPRSSPELLRAAVVDEGVLDDLAGAPGADLPAVARAARLARLLREARVLVEGGASAEELLWHLWSGTDWPARLQSASTRGGQGGRTAHRDLDAVCALFDEAARVEERRGHTGLASFLSTLVAQQIPADTLAEQGIRGEAVRLLTAHRSKGLEWRLVVVAHVQEEGWPDLRRRSTLLQADRIGSGHLVPPTSARELLADERRLFYVACTRARERLVVTAVASPDEDGEQASRFLAELGPTPQHVQGRPRRPLSLAGLVAELRRTVADDTQSEVLRRAAAERLARLGAQHREGTAWVPAADPATWWGTRAFTASAQPVREPDEPVRLSASALTTLEQCPAKWFLESEAGGARAATQAQGFGNVVHALADRISRGEVDLSGPDPVEALMEHVDAVWSRLPFRTPWSGGREREEVRKALTRFLAWHQRPEAREVLATEQRISTRVELPDGQQVHLHGYADRLEVDAEGRVVVIDLKTSKYKPTGEEITVHPQLGLYQLAVEHGAVDEVLTERRGEPSTAQPGGAELWQLRHEARGRLTVQTQAPQEPDEQGVRTIEHQLMAAARAVREEDFVARPGKHCDFCDFQPLCPAKSSGTVLS